MVDDFTLLQRRERTELIALAEADELVALAETLLGRLGQPTVVTAPEVDTTLYDDCERAAQDYCELVIGASDDELESCVANYTFQCVSGPSD